MEVGQSRSGMFSGRMGRLAYFLFAVYSAVVVAICLALSQVSPDGSALRVIFNILTFVSYLVVVVLSVGAGIKRWHDLDQSGWMVLLQLVPLVNLIVSLVLLFMPGTKGGNRYGEPASGKLDPKSVYGF